MKPARPGWLPPANVISMIIALAVILGLIMWLVLGGWLQGFIAGIVFAAAFDLAALVVIVGAWTAIWRRGNATAPAAAHAGAAEVALWI